MSPWLLSGAFLGWGLGANDSANIFGTAVYTKAVKYSTAVILTAIFVILGATLDGHRGIEKLSEFAFAGGINSNIAAFLVMLSAALTVAVMTVLKLPVSTSQAVIGAILGGGILKGTANLQASVQFLSAWVVTPIGAMVISFIIYGVVSKVVSEKMTHFRFYEIFIRTGYIFAGIFGAYSLGANNVANVTAVFAGNLHLVDTRWATIIGGVTIAIGVLTYSKAVMSTVGESIVPLSPIAGFIVVIATALTVYVYARIGIPVSTSQAVVGAIIGIGLKTGAKSIHFKVVRNIVFAWLGTPTIAGLVSLLFSLIIL